MSHPDPTYDPEDRITQLEWEVEKLLNVKGPPPAGDLAKLSEKFLPDEIEWRIQSTGKKQDGTPWALIVPYITSRAVMNRLDTVVGPQNWQDAYHLEKDGVICSLIIRVGAEWITKSDGAHNTEIEGFKGGISDALKRAAVKWGIGRYLYDCPKTYADISQTKRDGFHWATSKDGVFYWAVPKTVKL